MSPRTNCSAASPAHRRWLRSVLGLSISLTGRDRVAGTLCRAGTRDIAPLGATMRATPRPGALPNKPRLHCVRAQRLDSWLSLQLSVSASSGCLACPPAGALPQSSPYALDTTVFATSAESPHDSPATRSRSSGCGSRLSVFDIRHHPELPAHLPATLPTLRH